jgi:cell division protein FtsL
MWLPAMLLIVLGVTAMATIGSRLLLLESHRTLEQLEQERRRLLDHEQALQLEWVSRTDLNVVERRARQELGMRTPLPEQWHLVPRTLLEP